MDVKGEEFLRRKFLHLFNNFDHDKKGFIQREDAELQSKKLLAVLRRQLQEKGIKDTEIEKRVEEFKAKWMPGAMKYFFEMSQFAKEGAAEKITKKDFISFNMSIREHIAKNGALPSWFEHSLRMSFSECWGTQDNGLLEENGLELLPGVVKESKSFCYQQLTDNNNNKIGVSEFLTLIQGYYNVDDPEHNSKYIHGYQ